MQRVDTCLKLPDALSTMAKSPLSQPQRTKQNSKEHALTKTPIIKLAAGTQEIRGNSNVHDNKLRASIKTGTNK